MGLICGSGYTGPMASPDPKRLESADLSVTPDRGEISNARGESIRLGPVNMRVLGFLMSRAGRVVTRAELFDAVWKNQVVGDDALTRSISDIRAEIGRLSDRENLIETLPKRGYRWTAEVREASRDHLYNGPPSEDPAPAADSTAASRTRPIVVSWLGRGAIYFVALGVIASAGVWLADQLARPGQPIVAVLPIKAEAAQRELASGIEQQLTRYLIGLDRIDLLAASAVESRPSNPFPYFYYEFGASWLIEDELRSLPHDTELIVTLVDARTGIVLFQSTAVIDDGATAPAQNLDPAFRSLAEFFDSKPAH
jgi:DNA-binding winged helix-turn-helix (wHTH) protein